MANKKHKGGKVMGEENEGIYEYKMNTSDWPYLFENANMNKELAGFAPVKAKPIIKEPLDIEYDIKINMDPPTRKRYAMIGMDDLLTALSALEQLRNESGLFPDQLTLYYKLLAVYHGREEKK